MRTFVNWWKLISWQPMRIFGPLHLILLAVILVISALLAIACRKQWISPRATRLSVGALLAVNELGWWIYRYSREGVHSANLPLQLCDALVWLSVLACFTLVPVMVEFVYFAGIAGAGLALLTPDLAAPWPSYPAIYFLWRMAELWWRFYCWRSADLSTSARTRYCAASDCCCATGCSWAQSTHSMAATICICEPNRKAVHRSIGLARVHGIWPARLRWGWRCL